MGERARRRQQEKEEQPHTRKWLVWTGLIVVLGIALVVGGPWVYAQYLMRGAPDPYAASTPEVTQVPLGVIQIDGTWSMQPGSEAGYRLDETLSGQEVTTVGRTENVTGVIVVAGGMLTEARIEVDVASITSEESARDTFFRRALDASTHPQATFELAEVVDVAAIGESPVRLTLEVPGTLTMHGVSRPVTANLEVQRVPEGIEVVGSVPVVLADYALVAPDLGWVVVQPEGLIEVRLIFNH